MSPLLSVTVTEKSRKMKAGLVGPKLFPYKTIASKTSISLKMGKGKTSKSYSEKSKITLDEGRPTWHFQTFSALVRMVAGQ